MKKLFSRTLALTFALLLAFSALASSLPSPSEDFYYYDAAGVLDYETEAVIYYNNVELQKATGSQIVVAAVDTTGSLSRQQYAYRLASKWAVGDKKKDNGFLLLRMQGLRQTVHAIHGSDGLKGAGLQDRASSGNHLLEVEHVEKTDRLHMEVKLFHSSPPSYPPLSTLPPCRRPYR